MMDAGVIDTDTSQIHKNINTKYLASVDITVCVDIIHKMI